MTAAERKYKAADAKTRQYMRDLAEHELRDQKMLDTMLRWEREIEEVNP